jgi:dynein heavy chain
MVIGMELACVMNQKKPKKEMKNKVQGDADGWFECARTQLLNNPNAFLQAMINYDKENIPASVVKRANAILESDDFTLEKVTSASSALLAILKWSNAMMKYYELLKIVNPKRAKVAEMNEKLAIVRASLAEKREKLRQVEETIAGLEKMF